MFILSIFIIGVVDYRMVYASELEEADNIEISLEQEEKEEYEITVSTLEEFKEQKKIDEQQKRIEEELKKKQEEHQKQVEEQEKKEEKIKEELESTGDYGKKYIEAYYNGEFKVDDIERLERIVQAEAGGSDEKAAGLVAQSIKDNMIDKGVNSVSEIQQVMSYAKVLDKEPTEQTKTAVYNVFNLGKPYVEHRILYFYAPQRVESSFHESQKFILEYNGHRYFDRK